MKTEKRIRAVRGKGARWRQHHAVGHVSQERKVGGTQFHLKA